MAKAQITIKRFDDGTAGFVLWSAARQLLLVGGRVAVADLPGAIQDLVQHCGSPTHYKIRIAEDAWVLELHTPDGRRLAWSSPQDSPSIARDLMNLAIAQGPQAELQKPA